MRGSVKRVTTQSWPERVMESIKGIGIGLLLFVIAFPLLFWNEGRAVMTAKSLTEGRQAVMSIGADFVDPANSGRLVHVTGLATTEEILVDPMFGVSANAIKLGRIVSVYQWQEETESETRTKLGGGTETVTTYSYKTAWSGHLIDSSRFQTPEGHINPAAKPYEDRFQSASEVTLGVFVLPSSLVNQMGNFQPLVLSEQIRAALPGDLREQTKLHDGSLYFGLDPQNPQVGDIKVIFTAVKPSLVAVVAQQVGNTFEPYRAKAGGSIEMLRVGTFSSGEVFQQAISENVAVTWGMRVTGFLMMFWGIFLVFRPLAVVADILPFLGSFLRVGIGIFAFIVALALFLLTIGLGWVFHRPLIGIPLLLLAAAAFVGLNQLKRKKKVAPAVAFRPEGDTTANAGNDLPKPPDFHGFHP